MRFGAGGLSRYDLLDGMRRMREAASQPPVGALHVELLGPRQMFSPARSGWCHGIGIRAWRYTGGRGA
eukprot:55664-Eustigmatos_ZCMA.PRE.1